MKVRLVILAGLLAVAACQPKSPTTTSADSAQPPVAVVNGVPISRQFFDFYLKGTTGAKNPADVSADQREQLLDTLVRFQVVAQQADKDGLVKEQDTQDMLEAARLNVLRQIVLERYLKDKKPTDAELHAEYDTQVAALAHTEYHARHILVQTEPSAESIIKQLDQGAKFADLASKDSIDSSKTNGGDLGWFTPDHMVKSFSDAVVQLKPGTYTRTPVQTQYGWHVIYLEDTRPLQPPSFDSVRQRLTQIVLQKKFKAYTDELLKNAKVTKSF
jgi:peptidyl-prolyl cis-trans isomerase C